MSFVSDELRSRMASSKVAAYWFARWSCLGAVVGCVSTANAPYEPAASKGGASTQGNVAGTANGGGAGSLTLEGGTSGDGAEDAGESRGGSTARASCRSTADCAPPYPYCIESKRVCGQCLSNINCRGTGAGLCQLESHDCVTCLNDSHCSLPTPYCSPAGKCVECLSSANCAAARVACDMREHICVSECQTNEDCAGSREQSRCDPARNLCVTCLADADCSGVTPRCDGGHGRCVQCTDDAGCSPGSTCAGGICEETPR